eukprot:1796740-Pyramimonas_sp.AAC.1
MGTVFCWEETSREDNHCVGFPRVNKELLRHAAVVLGVICGLNKECGLGKLDGGSCIGAAAC